MINGGGNTATITIVESLVDQFEDTGTILVYDDVVCDELEVAGCKR